MTVERIKAQQKRALTVAQKPIGLTGTTTVVQSLNRVGASQPKNLTHLIGQQTLSSALIK